MTSKQGPNHVVVDGSNIATEGRSLPSLAQLNDAVLAFLEDHPDVTVTVVVDATFGHRIDKSEVKEFDAAVANNELVAPPAGAVGRGDAFVLGIAHKANATVLSNDSFQEFHGDYEWLFDEGRLIGGKPVPHVGWVFVTRTPVRGPISRKAVRESGRPEPRRSRSRSSEAPSKRTARTASPEASKPLPVPTSPPPGRAPATKAPAAKAPAAVARDAVNDLMPFLEFVEHHPVGTSVNATVESYSSHGAYVQIGQVRGYVPLRLMGDPPPRSAREAMKIGDAVTLVVESFAPARRSIDCAVPHMAAVVTPQDTSAVLDAAVDGRDLDVTTPAAKPAAKGSGRHRAATKPAAPTKAAAKTAAPKKAAAKTAAARTLSSDTVAPKKTAAKKAAAKKIAAKRTAAKQAAPEKRAPRRRPRRRRSSRRPRRRRRPPRRLQPRRPRRRRRPPSAPAKKAPAKKDPAKKAPAKKDPAKKAAAATRPATKAAGSAPAPRRRRSAGEPSA
jgi:hypothetical protein